jgi:hypothetical protein
MPAGVALTRRRQPDGSAVLARTLTASGFNQTIAPFGVEVGNCEFADARFDERKRHSRACSASSNQKRSFALGIEAAYTQCLEQSDAVSHIADPSVLLTAHRVDRGQKPGPVGYRIAVGKCRELVRHRDHEAVDVAGALGCCHERGEVRVSHMRGNTDRVDPARGKGAG